MFLGGAAGYGLTGCAAVSPSSGVASSDLSLRNMGIEGNLPQVRMDPERISQVVNNLISNAIKFSNPDTTITLGAKSVGGSVEVYVADQGLGIPQDEVDKVFAEFGKTSVRPTAGEPSTGLGLAIVKRMVETHGGRIWVESQEGRGSVFTFSLPVVEDDG